MSRGLPFFFTLLAAAALGWIFYAQAGGREWLGQLGKPEPEKPLDPAFLRLSSEEILRLPLAVRFDQPMGTEHGALTYNARPFRTARHLGDDLNGIGGGNSDLGDSVYAAGAGLVAYAGEPGAGWGKMLIVAHRVPDAELPRGWRVWQTVYAHLDSMEVKAGETVMRGQKIGTVGTANGQYLAHLHFEVREGPYINPAQGYADAPLNRVSPELFLAKHRGAPPELLNPAPRLEGESGAGR